MPTAPRGPTRLRSPLARAVVPVLAGLLVLVAIALFTWGIAAYISRGGAEVSERLAPTRFEVASTQTAARIVADDGPIMLPGLNTTTGERTFVLDHEGDDPATGWVVYAAYPAAGDPACTVEQVIGTDEFIDCDGNHILVTDLAPPPAGVNPVVENGRTLVLDLSGVTEPT
ncbi:MAG: hypothetical protein ABWZ42_01585 [Ilumatobacteraceae bacterium]